MKKYFFPIVLAFIASTSFAQVGIGTITPNESSQLEVNAANKGVLIPQVALQSITDDITIQPGNVNSLLVFNTTNNTNIQPGYFYWFQDRWFKLLNIADLEDFVTPETSDLVLEVVGTNLRLTDAFGNSTSIPLADMGIVPVIDDLDLEVANDNLSVTDIFGNNATIPLADMGIVPVTDDLDLEVANDNLSVTDIFGNNATIPTQNLITSNVLDFDGQTGELFVTVNGVDSNSVNVTSPWKIQGTTNNSISVSDNVFHSGSVAIGADVIPQISTPTGTVNPKFFVQGDARFSGKIYSSNSRYADYVFEKYFTGESTIDSDYQFNKLNDVKEFITKNHHLPGVTPIGDLLKTDEGYMIDFSKLSIEQLEKIEELYIHTIEQQDLIDGQKAEIQKQNQEIKLLNERLTKLENVLNKQ